MSQIPHHAKKVFTGVIYDVYQREQKLFDGSMSTFECIDRGSSAFVLPIIGDKIVLTTEHQPTGEFRKYGLLGGRCNKGEAPIIGAKREFQEESGMTCEVLEHRLTGNDRSYSMIRDRHYFIAKGCKLTGKTELDRGGEIITLNMVSFDEFVELCISRQISYYDMNLKVVELKLANKLHELRDLFFQ